ncbi:plasmid transfer protein [Sphingobacterium composti Ten et al. 2007 non Yoo et al. 2007]|uniref:plasmid transfer protein n=1 Tax=Sphingobacterium composti TaxID=363260 RepID=UPI001F18AEAE|nr:plasmid transfer protein [Sphingobacterium composti Ten et al. 2007 non Yoo et al. 2007]
MKILNFLCSLFKINIPSINTNVPESFQDTFNFLQGNGVYEEGVMHFLRGMKDTMWTHFDVFIADAQALAAIFMLISFAIRSYDMISGDKKLEIMPLLRPFGLAMVIIWWSPFTRVIAYPTDIIAAKTEALFDTGQLQVNALRIKRANLMIKIADQLTTIQAQTEVAQKEADSWYGKAWESVTSTVKEGFTNVWNTVTQLKNRMQVNLQLLLTFTLETLALWVLRICVYIIFMIQIIYSTILIILGPFSVSTSILPAFRDSFSNWIARFVSVNLYSGIAYLVMHISSLFQQYAMEAEITRYEQLLATSGDTLEKMGWFASNGILSFGIVIISFIIGGLTMLTVPSISTWIISTSGITSAVSTVARNSSAAWRTATKIATKL